MVDRAWRPRKYNHLERNFVLFIGKIARSAKQNVVLSINFLIHRRNNNRPKILFVNIQKRGVKGICHDVKNRRVIKRND
jgi:hypothetical protein